MGRNKEIRKKVEGHRRMVLEHQAKIKEGLEFSNPRESLMAYWQKRIRQVELKIFHWEEQLRPH